MNYERLSQTYFNEANILKNHIKLLKVEYSKPEFSNNLQLKNRISILYKMYLELIHVGRYLKKKQRLIKRCERKY